MKISLLPPYSNDWRFGYIVINPESRKTVILFNNSKDRSSVSYARYLMSTSLGRYLTNEEQVDHIDDDKTNDVISNLQILTAKENMAKCIRGETLVDFKCPVCSKGFQLTARQSHRINPCCSRHCGGKKGRLKVLASKNTPLVLPQG